MKAARLAVFCSLVFLAPGCGERSDPPTDAPDPLIAREVLTIAAYGLADREQRVAHP